MVEDNDLDRMREQGPDELDTEGLSAETDQEEREPSHPGRTLRDLLDDANLSQEALAEILGVSRDTVSKICNEHWGISPEMAVKLSVVFDLSAEFWLNLDRRRELWDAQKSMRNEVDQIKKRFHKLKDTA